jgi:hypothetical protein
MQMSLEQQLQAALAPCEPGPQPLLKVMARISAAQKMQGTRRTSRPRVLFGTLLIVAAAASMLALWKADAPAPQVATTNRLDPSATSVAGKQMPGTAPEPTFQAAEQRPAGERSGQKSPGTASFTVRVRSLQNNATNSAARRAVETFHAALLDDLRAVPGLVLVTHETAGFAPDTPTDFRLTLTGSDLPIDRFLVKLDAESVARRLTLPIRLSGDIAPECAGTGAPDCADPVTVAGSVLQLLRKNFFPANSVARQELLARVLDPSLSATDRLNALMDMSLQSLQDGDRVDREESTRQAQQIVRSLADLGATASDPGDRAQVWRAVRYRPNTGLIPPLVDALRRDRDEKVRVEAATTLATDYAAEPQAHAALEAAAQEDPVPIVRALARRGVLGEAAWTEYVVSSLKDTSLTASARMEALLLTMNQRGKVHDLGRLLTDNDAIEAFADAFSRVQASGGSEGPTAVLLSKLGSVYHPAFTGVLLDSLDRAKQPSVRQSIVSQLIRRSADVRVQTALRKLSAEDADPELRQMAAQALRP